MCHGVYLQHLDTNLSLVQSEKMLRFTRMVFTPQAWLHFKLFTRWIVALITL